jgi:hypothetical protein
MFSQMQSGTKLSQHLQTYLRFFPHKVKNIKHDIFLKRLNPHENYKETCQASRQLGKFILCVAGLTL